MPIQGPVVVVADQPPPDLVKALSAAGAFPVLESPAAQAAEAIAAANPSAAILIHDGGLDAATMAALEAIAYQQQPLLPIFARIATDLRFAHAGLLPLAANLDIQCLVACLQSALRVRASHAAVLGRIDILKGRGVALPDFPDTDPLEDATVLVVGRSRSYPELSTAIGNQAGLIGALSLETAARNLKSRVVDGIAIGDGFSPRMIGAFLTVLAEDSRFRDLPVAMLSNTGFDFESLLPNFSTHNDIGILVDHLMPYVRLQAFEMRIRRMRATLDSKGMVDPDTGLLTGEAFLRELDRALRDCGQRGVGLSIARFSFPENHDRRTNFDAARLVSRLVRDVDFGSRDDDGSVVLVFTETDLRHAHVVARRLASILRKTMLHPGERPVAPAITLATMKSSDNIASLLARVAGPTELAAE